jgi:hypothetical protein
MMRQRLRPMPLKADLDKLYARPHEHERWADHRIRVEVTTALALSVVRHDSTVVDLSCGDAAIARNLYDRHAVRLILGDYAPAPPWNKFLPGGADQLVGPIEETVDQVRDRQADLWILSETIEHLDDPDAVLKQIRAKTNMLILSTPDGETDARNPEHVWGWDTAAVREMLEDAGFDPIICNVLDLRPGGFEYAFQIWACR